MTISDKAIRAGARAVKAGWFPDDETCIEVATVVLNAAHEAAPPVEVGEFKPTHRHYKGGLYQVLCPFAEHEATGEPLVVYINKDGRVWVRPKMDFDAILPDGVSRFTSLAAAPTPDAGEG